MNSFYWKLTFLLFLFSARQAFAQTDVYKHYTRENGLAGNTVYSATQDKDGFIWFGTENGVSRFDGKNFVNFTTNDGLTDNEVLEMYADSKGRVWFICFTGSVCYYYKGRIYNYENNTQLSKDYIPTRSSFRGFFEDNEGTLWFLTPFIWKYNDDPHKLISVQANINDKIITLLKTPKNENSIDLLIIDNRNLSVTRLKKDLKGIIHLIPVNGKALLSVMGTVPSSMVPFKPGLFFVKLKNSISLFRVTDQEISLLKKIEFDFDISKLNYDEKSGQIWISTYRAGAIRVNDSLEIMEQRLTREKISNSFVDLNKNCWYTTLGNGIFMFNSSKIKSLKSSDGIYSDEIYSLSKIDEHELVLGFENGMAQHLVNGKIALPKKISYSNEISNKLRGAIKNKKGELLYFTDREVIRNEKPVKPKSFTAAWAVKDVAYFQDSIVAVATHAGAYLFFPSGDCDTIIFKRATALEITGGNQQQLYIATIDSLFLLKSVNDLVPVKNYDVLKYGRISDMSYSNNKMLFIATYNAGVICLFNDRVVTVMEKDGLMSNQCRKLFLENDSSLWVTTNTGITKLVFDSQARLQKLHNYSSSEGYSSDNIYGFCKLDNNIWLAGDNGLDYFTESQITTEQDHSVQITSFTINNSFTDFYNQELHLNKDDNIKISFSGISVSSADKLTYRYMLEGIDKDWMVTSSNQIEWPNLPAGSYKFTVYSIDKNNRASLSPAVVSFEVFPAFWETWWFILIASILLVLLFFCLFLYRVKMIKSAEVEKTKINKQFAELKLEAVRSQMDPHFIFNCLNAIQHFNIREDYKSAQYFISEFAKLIRKTLNHSHRDFILLSDEIELLETYIQLEKLRFEDLIDYTVEIADEVKGQLNELLVPSLIFQPYVENAINHGIKYLKRGSGKLTLQFEIRNKRLFVTLEDNGIGILQSKRIKQYLGWDDASYGISLNDSHIDVINKIHDLNISYTITDKSTTPTKQQGTIVEISLPLKLKTL